MVDSKLYILIAYPYFKPSMYTTLMNQPYGKYELIIDSGAFTAWNTGKPIHLDNYCKFLDTLKPLGDFKAVQLDVIGDPEASYKNYLTMKSRGYDVIPVFTRGDNIEQLENLYEHTDYIMLGGVAKGSGNGNYVKYFSERNHNRKCHWLGFVKMDFIKHYKPYSVDSSSWSSALRFGEIRLSKPDGSLLSISKRVFCKRPSNDVMNLLRRLGLSDHQISILRFNDSWVNSGFKGTVFPEVKNEGIKNYASLINVMSHIKRMHEVREEVGTKIFLALASDDQLNTVIAAYDYMKDKGII